MFVLNVSGLISGSINELFLTEFPQQIHSIEVKGIAISQLKTKKIWKSRITVETLNLMRLG
ncbi:MAG: hypothetical protein IRD7MM_02775 [Candidatus Midichloria mitochondrii]|uniref:hypothetical protein n=1 Tax=Candidatus Midichloria mitochondrii TaxID=234827 RepID=UPI00059D7AA7|nr:hypothetical protein [Candidatus Midichloria mitochondrii]MDJ1256836.1 hypothetical protein [Candidatus Midichloria mitochondrii]MDJ1299347.1 hypothetical protein [Candidatus Midichloria mitochondrii]MDJ1313420.1 hypothetical protein [Candidatus Midichloria mitochondrii]MDJ1584122.1 hypothetical protein [Candidatus Midichloria mitochondrii]